MSDTRADHFILFEVVGTTYALASHAVAHIEMVDQITRVPNAPPWVDGVVFSRGAVIPAVSLRAKFGFERAAHDLRTRLVVVQDAGRTVGLLADSCREFMTITPERIQPPGDAMGEAGGRYIQGIATVNDRLIVVLSIEPLLTAADPVLTA